MKTQALAIIRHRWMPAMLAVVAVFLAVRPAQATVALKVSGTAVEITGGSGRQAWTLHYGNVSGMEFHPLLQEVSPTRAYYSRGGWLRLIDTDKGVVIGRWHLPGEIIGLKPAGGDTVDVLCDENLGSQVSFKNTYRLDPAAPKLPGVGVENLRLQRVPLIEGQFVANVVAPYGVIPIDPKTAREYLDRAKDMAARDPLSPFVRINYARLLRALGDAQADKEFEAAIETPTTDYIEMLPISAVLDRGKEPAWAKKAYERAYQNFWQTGNDPRLFSALIGRFILYAPDDPATPEARKEYTEKAYQLTPYGEGAPWAWAIYARQLEKAGAPEAGLWKARAADALTNNKFPMLDVIAELDRWALVAMSAVLAFILYIVVVDLRYRKQGKLDKKAGRVTFIAVHWSKGQRVALALVVVAAWAAVGMGGGMTTAMLRMSAAPISSVMGTFAGRLTQWQFERLPASPARDLLVAQSYLQSGEYEKAEKLYRALPQFAESWNNLGVTLAKSGRASEARAAYAQALKINPQLEEAALNAGQGAHGFWAELHQKYAPGEAMIAPPSRDEMFEAYTGGRARYMAALAGPIILARRYTLPYSMMESSPTVTFIIIGVVTLVALTVLTLPFFPYREVTQAPGRGHAILEILFPGTAPAWGALGGLVLTAGVFCVFKWFLVWKFNGMTPMMSLAFPNLQRPYGVVTNMEQISELFRPGGVWLYGIPGALFVVNLVVVALSWRQKKSAAVGAGAGR